MLNVRAAWDLAARELADVCDDRSAVQSGPQPDGGYRLVPDHGCLFDVVDRNHDGVISRNEFQDALQAHVIEGSELLASTGTTRGAAQLRVSALVPAQMQGDQSRPGSGRRARGQRQDFAEPTSSNGEVCPRSDWPAPIPAVHQEARGARQGKHVQRSLARRPSPLGTGGAAVRNVAETTRALLEGLETALASRAAAMAGSFHAWRCEAALARTGRLYQQELERHHDRWAACLEHHRRGFEAELWVHAEQVMAQRLLLSRQRSLLVDRSLLGERRGLRRELLRRWRGHAELQGRRRGLLQCARAACRALAGGRAEAAARASLAAWRRLAGSPRRAHQRGLLAAALGRWAGAARGRGLAARRRAAVQLQVSRWGRRSGARDLHVAYLAWKLSVARAGPTNAQMAGLRYEMEVLQEKMHANENSHRNMLRQQMSEVEQCRERAHKVVEAAMMQWRLFERMRLARSTLHAWSKCMVDQRHTRRQQLAIDSFLSQSLKAVAFAELHADFTAWAALTRLERWSRVNEELIIQERQQWTDQFNERHQTHQCDMESMHEMLSRSRIRGQEVAKFMLRQWTLSHQQRLKAAVLTEWILAITSPTQARRHRIAMKDVALRLSNCNTLGLVQVVLLHWQSSTRWTAEGSQLRVEKGICDQMMGEQMHKASCKREALAAGCIEAIGMCHHILLQITCFSAWTDALEACKAALDEQRRRDADAKLAQALVRAKSKSRCAACCKHFMAWSHVVERERKRHEVILGLSAFVCGRKRNKESRGLLVSTFVDWCRESKLAACQRHRYQMHCTLHETRTCVHRLMRERGTLEEQLGLYYRQIDHVTEMLQKEVRIKGEMAGELRSAYGKHWPAGLPPSPADAAVGSRGAPEAGFSRCSSEETLDLCSSPCAQESGGAVHVSPSATGWRLGSSEPPPIPKLPFASLDDTTDTLSPSSPHSSGMLHALCTWDEAVARMGAEGLVRIQEPDLL